MARAGGTALNPLAAGTHQAGDGTAARAGAVPQARPSLCVHSGITSAQPRALKNAQARCVIWIPRVRFAPFCFALPARMQIHPRGFTHTLTQSRANPLGRGTSTCTASSWNSWNRWRPILLVSLPVYLNCWALGCCVAAMQCGPVVGPPWPRAGGGDNRCAPTYLPRTVLEPHSPGQSAGSSLNGPFTLQVLQPHCANKRVALDLSGLGGAAGRRWLPRGGPLPELAGAAKGHVRQAGAAAGSGWG